MKLLQTAVDLKRWMGTRPFTTILIIVMVVAVVDLMFTG